MAVKKSKKKVARRKPAKKKKAVRAKKPLKKRKPAVKKLKQKIIGVVTHYFPKVRAGVIKLKVPISVGDSIKIKGHTTDFTQTITSMQIDRVPVQKAKKGGEIGLLVNSRVRAGDLALKP